MRQFKTTGKTICPSFIVRLAQVLPFVLLIWLAGCGYKNSPVLLKTPEKLKTYGAPIYRYNVTVDSAAPPYQHTIQPDNRVRILQLNKDLGEATASLGISEGFLVDLNGNIRLPIVGDVYVQGLTRQEAARLLEKVFGIYFKDPMFQIEVINLYVMVIGEAGTNSGGFFVSLDKERTHLLEVLGKAGGVPNFTKMRYVKIVRGDYKNPQIIIVDMSQLSAIREDDLIMQNGDLVYLEPRGIRILSESITPYISLFAFLNFFGTIVLIVNLLGGNRNNN